MIERNRFKVSCKAAIYSDDVKKVLIMAIPANGPDSYGLPGGHLEPGETIDEAMKRELSEELGVQGVILQHADFFMHSNGKVVLGFTGSANEATLSMSPSAPDKEYGVWMTKREIEMLKIDSYHDFILSNWPR